MNAIVRLMYGGLCGFVVSAVIRSRILLDSQLVQAHSTRARFWLKLRHISRGVLGILLMLLGALGTRRLSDLDWLGFIALVVGAGCGAIRPWRSLLRANKNAP